MAGNYPDYPSWRMAWDRDGTQAFNINAANVPGQLTSASMIAMNDESDGEYRILGVNGSGSLVLIFPELRDLDAYFFASKGANPTVRVSSDTTNGVDGTWTTITYSGTNSALYAAKPTYRTAIVSSTALAIKAIKFSGSTGPSGGWDVASLHLFGEPVPGANPNRLELWHPTLDEKLGPAHLDWGDVPRSSSGDRQFRVKNLSTNMTAGQARVAMESLTDTNPSVVAQHTLSYGGGSFIAQVNIGDLAPGAISGPVTIRRITPSDATLSLWTFRVFAESTNWV